MGFYGNISNTSKTSFQFDRVYANKRDMDNSALLGDGVYPGRFVLVDYSEEVNDSFYELDADGANIYWMYDGKLYLGAPSMTDVIVNQETQEKKRFFNYPDAALMVTRANSDYNVGKMIKVEPGKRISNINSTSLFFRVTNITTAGKYEVSFDANMTQYCEWLDNYIEESITTNPANANLTPVALQGRIDQAIKDSYVQIELSTLTYESGVFFTFKNEIFTLDTTGEFNPNTKYYTRKEFRDLEVFLTSSTDNNENVKYGEDIITSNYQLQVGHYYCIPKHHRYNVNYLTEYWQIALVDSQTQEYTWRAIVDDVTATDNYFKNLSIDRAYISEYGEGNTTLAGRGYDSTVWQKVVKNGRDKYVMIAELNSVVPTFDVAYDPPTTIPIIPHFDKDSTNVYYKLHTQPQWGLRTKAANQIQGPRIDSTGSFGGTTNLSEDTVIYPSDQITKWTSDFYNTYTGTSKMKYFDASSSSWVDEKPRENKDEIKAAVYYNKKGFNPDTIAYSQDLIDETMKDKGYNFSVATSGWTNEDNISLLPTGLSGQEYNTHNKGQATEPRVDTQELAIMLPSLGDTVSKVWDMIFGGRETNEHIARTNKRNMDYKWEDGKGHIDRNGLRLVDYQTDNAYNRAHVETLAGCINSVHDLMGMIVGSDTPQNLAKNLQNLHKDRIYYVNPATVTANELKDATIAAVADLQGQYTMKHKTFDYVTAELKNKYVLEDGVITDVTKYYVKLEDGTYRKAVAGDTGPFYKIVKTPKNTSIYTDITDKIKQWEDKYWYQDINSSPYSKDASGNPIKSKQDYIKDNNYQKENKYFSITGVGDPFKLSGAYEPGKYYYLSKGNYIKDFNETATIGRTYYTIDQDKVHSIKARYNGIYMPGLYYYYDAEKDNYLIDMSIDGTREVNEQPVQNVHYSIKVTDKDKEDLGYVKEIHYIVISRDNVPVLLSTGNTVFYRDYSGTTWVDDEGRSFDYVAIDANHKVSASYTYAVQQIVYTPSTEQVEIDTDKQLELTKYKKNTFFFVSYNIKGEVSEYTLITDIKQIDPNDDSQVICALGKWPEGELTEGSPYISSTDNGSALYWAVKSQSSFYTPHTYHYVTKEGSYILDNYSNMTHDYYVKLEDKNITEANFNGVIFYEPNEYYTQNPSTGEYELLRDLTLPDYIGPGDGEQRIYKADKLYVYSDTNGVYQKGAEWNMDITEIPNGVTLAKRADRWELVPIQDFARNLNTMHGLILKINQTLLSGDLLTRDDTTVQGVVNKMRDILLRFDSLQPRTLMVVDNCGRISGCTWDTSQNDSVGKTKDSVNYATGVNEDKFPQVAHNAEKVNQWITVNVDGTPKNPKVRIHHNFQPVNNTTTTLNFNTSSGNTFVLYEPYVDATGHVVGNTKKTCTLPHNFQSFTLGEASTAVTFGTHTTGTVTADTLRDTMTLLSGNRWIVGAVNADNDSITFYHAAPDASSKSTGTTKTGNETPKFGKTFSIPEVKYDEAGHIFKVGTHTVTIPKMSLNDETTGNILTGLSLADENGELTLTKANLTSVKMNGYSRGTDKTDVATGDTLGKAIGKLETRIMELEEKVAELEGVITPEE